MGAALALTFLSQDQQASRSRKPETAARAAREVRRHRPAERYTGSFGRSSAAQAPRQGRPDANGHSVQAATALESLSVVERQVGCWLPSCLKNPYLNPGRPPCLLEAGLPLCTGSGARRGSYWRSPARPTQAGLPACWSSGRSTAQKRAAVALPRTHLRYGVVCLPAGRSAADTQQHAGEGGHSGGCRCCHRPAGQLACAGVVPTRAGPGDERGSRQWGEHAATLALPPNLLHRPSSAMRAAKGHMHA